MSRSTVNFESDGHAYSLRVTMNAMVLYQEKSGGESFIEGAAVVEQRPTDVIRIRKLLWSAMQHLDDITLEKAGDIMDGLGFAETIRIIGKALTTSYPELVPAEDDEGNAPEAELPPPTKKSATK